jgi:hypothetical protein
MAVASSSTVTAAAAMWGSNRMKKGQNKIDKSIARHLAR